MSDLQNKKIYGPDGWHNAALSAILSDDLGISLFDF